MSIHKRQVWLPVTLSVSLIIGMVFGYKLHENMGDFAPRIGSKPNLNSQLNELIELIESRYVDSLSTDSLKQTTIESLINTLDPHSLYIPAEEIDGMNEDLQGNYYGIGIQFEMIRDTLTILSVFDATPAAKAGLQVGDQIIQVDSFRVSGKNLKDAEIRRKVRGTKGSAVTVRLLRNHKALTVSMQRSKIFSGNIDAAYLIAPGTAYIRISKFAENTYEEFMEKLEALKAQGMEKMILDLRDNGGGILDDAVQIADEFIEGNKEIVSTRGAYMSPETYTARRPGLFEKGKLVVLINEHTASASEVLAGAIQDWNRGTVIGRRSFGKGLVQEQFTLSDGAALRLTVARYYTPLGRCIQKPYQNGIDTTYEEEISQRIQDGEIFRKQNNAHKGKIFVTPDGRKLYSEEGISPDIHIPADSADYRITGVNKHLNESIILIALSFYKNHKDTLKNIKSITQLTSLINADASINASVHTLAIQDKNLQFQDYTKRLLDEVAYNIAWMIWKEEGYYKLYNSKDSVVKKAMAMMQEH